MSVRHVLRSLLGNTTWQHMREFIQMWHFNAESVLDHIVLLVICWDTSERFTLKMIHQNEQKFLLITLFRNSFNYELKYFSNEKLEFQLLMYNFHFKNFLQFCCKKGQACYFLPGHLFRISDVFFSNCLTGQLFFHFIK